MVKNFHTAAARRGCTTTILIKLRSTIFTSTSTTLLCILVAASFINSPSTLIAHAKNRTVDWTYGTRDGSRKFDVLQVSFLAADDLKH